MRDRLPEPNESEYTNWYQRGWYYVDNGFNVSGLMSKRMAKRKVSGGLGLSYGLMIMRHSEAPWGWLKHIIKPGKNFG